MEPGKKMSTGKKVAIIVVIVLFVAGCIWGGIAYSNSQKKKEDDLKKDADKLAADVKDHLTK